ncbi:hypothetical protein COCNU_02G007040 [Cocos nucifera]|uniref:O-fucosyltransferase family protein n=1 Tax=Cocos nucifera TaxID=13894 RepID=A0A8K0HYQ5_COCNU|nr:hypothetical protein COCNU_02G007040 [Cocos nucifera]
MQRRRLRVRSLSLMRWLLSCAIGAIALGALMAVHVNVTYMVYSFRSAVVWDPPIFGLPPMLMALLFNDSNFSDVFDEEHFIHSLSSDVKIIKKLPKELKGTTKAIMQFRSWSGVEYYQDEISRLWDDYQVILAAKSDSRLANNNLPSDIQKLRCRAFYKALQFAPQIEALGKLLVERMRSYGPYIALHLRYEKDMLAFSGCTYGLSPAEADELARMRENISYWKVKDIDPQEQRTQGYCPLTPKEVGIFLSSLGYPSNTPVYVAAGEIYGGDSHMAELETRFPILMSKVQTKAVVVMQIAFRNDTALVVYTHQNSMTISLFYQDLLHPAICEEGSSLEVVISRFDSTIWAFESLQESDDQIITSVIQESLPNTTNDTPFGSSRAADCHPSVDHKHTINQKQVNLDISSFRISGYLAFEIRGAKSQVELSTNMLGSACSIKGTFELTWRA